jgi:heterodisulfide reductase subunit C
MDANVPAFSTDVVGQLGGETLRLCFQCGTCASSCPVARITSRFNPRRVIKRILAGQKQAVIADQAWLCCSCYNCQERCPQGVEIAELIYAVRNIAIQEGFTRQAFVEMARSLQENGRIAVVTRFTERRRAKLGLPPLQPTGVEALHKILVATSYQDRLAALKEGSV